MSRHDPLKLMVSVSPPDSAVDFVNLPKPG